VVARGKAFYSNHADIFVNTADRLQDIPFQDSESAVYSVDLRAAIQARPWLRADLGAELQRDQVRSRSFGDHDGHTVSPFLQVHLQATDRVRITAGVRHDRDDEDDLATVANTSANAAITVRTDGSGSLRLSYGEGFVLPGLSRFIVEDTVTPTTIVRPNPGLLAESSRSFEIGYRRELGDALALDVAAFRTEYDNLIGKFTTTDGPYTVETEANVAEARLTGLEAQLEAAVPLRAGRDLELRAGYGFLHTRDRRNARPLDYRPRHSAQLGAQLRVGRWGLGGDYRYRGAFAYTPPPPWPDADLRVASHRLDAFIRWERPAVAIQLTAANLADSRYLLRAGYQGPPRHVRLAVTLSQ
jgi:outer membrane receptor protein involved in Fe transport